MSVKSIPKKKERVESKVPESVQNSIINRIKEIRQSHGLTQQGFADALNEGLVEEKDKIGVFSVRHWEAGRHIPEVARLLQIANRFDVDLDYLTGRLSYHTHDNQIICQRTGLSEAAVEKLQRINSTNKATGLADIISLLIEHPDFEALLALLRENPEQGGEHPIHSGNVWITSTEREVLRFATSDKFSRISDDVREQAPPHSGTEWLYQLAYGLHSEGRLSDEQLSDVIEHYDQGDFDYSPAASTEKTNITLIQKPPTQREIKKITLVHAPAPPKEKVNYVLNYADEEKDKSK